MEELSLDDDLWESQSDSGHETADSDYFDELDEQTAAEAWHLRFGVQLPVVVLEPSKRLIRGLEHRQSEGRQVEDGGKRRLVIAKGVFVGGRALSRHTFRRSTS